MILFLCFFIFVMSQPETNWQRKRRENPPPIQGEWYWRRRKLEIFDRGEPIHEKSSQYQELILEMFKMCYEQNPLEAMWTMYGNRRRNGRDWCYDLDVIFERLVDKIDNPNN